MKHKLMYASLFLTFAVCVAAGIGFTYLTNYHQYGAGFAAVSYGFCAVCAMVAIAVCIWMLDDFDLFFDDLEVKNPIGMGFWILVLIAVAAFLPEPQLYISGAVAFSLVLTVGLKTMWDCVKKCHWALTVPVFCAWEAIVMIMSRNNKVVLFCAVVMLAATWAAVKMNECDKKGLRYGMCISEGVLIAAFAVMHFTSSRIQTARIERFFAPGGDELFVHVKNVISSCKAFTFEPVSAQTLFMNADYSNTYIILAEAMGFVLAAVIAALQIGAVAVMFIRTAKMKTPFYRYMANISVFALALYLVLALMSTFFVMPPIGIGAPLITRGGLWYVMPAVGMYVFALRQERIDRIIERMDRILEDMQ